MPRVGVIMGSRSDLPTMEKAVEMLKRFGVDYEVKIVSAHRTPELMFEYAKTAKRERIKSNNSWSRGSSSLTWNGI